MELVVVGFRNLFKGVIERVGSRLESTGVDVDRWEGACECGIDGGWILRDGDEVSHRYMELHDNVVEYLGLTTDSVKTLAKGWSG